ncbi:MAG TPA: type II asparaginase [Candidatus Acidoferrales bacterium]|nr:type II asparaginase [Candidatus Acidoferrales bacterium]
MLAREARRTLVAAICCCAIAAAQPAARLPAVKIIATGGTIAGEAATSAQAGYTSGQVGVETLIKAVPTLNKLARVTGEQISNIGSQDMSDEVWLKLAKRINQLAASPDVDGIVVTHGTDTMEETAYFLNLVLKTRKPVVLTGSMRPSTALSADGPLNIYNAVAVAADAKAAGRGVLVSINDQIHSAHDITKTHTTATDTFMSPYHGLIGATAYGVSQYYRFPFKSHTTETPFNVDSVASLPRVDILYVYEDMPGDLVDASVKAGAKGIVVAGVGDGNMPKAAMEALGRAARSGVVVVRASRVMLGFVGRNVEVDDDKMNFVASEELNPPKARVLLRLALMKTSDPKQIQTMFNTY